MGNTIESLHLGNGVTMMFSTYDWLLVRVLDSDTDWLVSRRFFIDYLLKYISSPLIIKYKFNSRTKLNEWFAVIGFLLCEGDIYPKTCEV